MRGTGAVAVGGLAVAAGGFWVLPALLVLMGFWWLGVC